MVTINTPQGGQDMRENKGHGSQSIIELGYKIPVNNLDNQYTYPIMLVVIDANGLID
jgi:hypothetical protein